MEDGLSFDGNVDWNTARLVNHSCEPNCEAQINEDVGIWLVALREIEDGEELTFNYGFDLEDYRKHPCHCGSRKCVGYIVGEDYWPKLRRKLKKKKAKAERKAAKERAMKGGRVEDILPSGNLKDTSLYNKI